MELLESDEERWKHFAVVTHRYDWQGERLLQWHREKQGTVEHGHGDLKNEFAAGTMPCGRFFANAAWLRIHILVYNLFRAFKLQVPPELMRSMRPKGLRCHLLNLPARITRHARWLVFFDDFRAPAAFCRLAFQKPLRHMPDIARVFERPIRLKFGGIAKTPEKHQPPWALWVWLNPRVSAYAVLAEARRILAAYAWGPTEAHSPT